MGRNCEKATAHVYRYLDREATVYRRVRVWWHLRRCPPCSGGFHFEAKLKQRIHDDCVEEPPPELYERLRAFLRQQDIGSGGAE
jgi:mycothiol system anti-sigma-R factor